MSSTFFGLNIAYSGLLNSNAALNTTANNIANVQTDGYSRQQVNSQAAQAIRSFQTYGCVGAGVETLAIERVRDEYYDQKYWNNNTKVGEFDMKAYYMKEMEDYFYDSGINGGFTEVFDQLMITGLQDLMDNPGDASTKTQFVGYAGALTDYFNSMVGNLQNMQKDINAELKVKVDEINSIASQIVSLNKQINTIEVGSTQIANELRDQRTLLVDRLSEIVDVEVTETDIVDTNFPDRNTGATRYVVKIAGGQPLLDMYDLKELTTVARETYEKVNQTDIDGLYDVYWQDGSRFKLSNAALGGELRGLVELRDGNNGEFFNGTVADIEVGVEIDKVKVDVTDAFLKDLNQCNLSDQGGIITLANQEYYYDSWSATCSVDASGEISYSYTFDINVEKSGGHVANSRVGKEAAIGSSFDYQGIPYYMSQLNEWVRTFSEKFNDILVQGNDGTGTIMFTGNHATDKEQFQYGDALVDVTGTDDDGNPVTTTYRFDQYLSLVEANPIPEELKGTSVTFSSTDDSYYRLTAENFAVLTAMATDPSLMTNKFKAGEGVEQNDLLRALNKMISEKDGNRFRGNSCSEFLEGILSDVALSASAANTFQASYQSVQHTIDNTRLSISGVDEDEEAVDLVKYQNAYNLASKMIQVFQEIYNRLILETGV